MSGPLIITGTGTGVGKTIATAALAARLGAGGTVAAVKPAQTGVGPGEPGDIDEIIRLAAPDAAVELARYPDPLAPDTAARQAGADPLTLGRVVEAVEALAAAHDHVLIEGAGGVLVRLGAEGFTLLDVAAALSAPLVVVAAAGLGTLNHTALTCRAVEAAGARCAGVVIGSWPEDPDLAARCNLTDLPEVTGAALLGRIPAGAGTLGREEFTAGARQWLSGEAAQR